MGILWAEWVSDNELERVPQRQVAYPISKSFTDFDRAGGPRGMGPGGPRGGPNHNGGAGAAGDGFFPGNMNQNRFNQPTSLMQMRIPPPAAFNQRMGGPGGPGNGVGPMFMRNQGGSGPGGGGRQQGPGEFTVKSNKFLY